jgi:hypothetical protein
MGNLQMIDFHINDYSVWHLYGFGAVLLVGYGMLAKPGSEVLTKMWVGYAFLAAILGFMNNGSDTDGQDSEDSEDNQDIWKLYGLGAILLVGYGMIMKPGSETLKKLWVGYAVVAAILGFMNR